LKSFPRPKDTFPESLRQLWIRQLCILAKRKSIPKNRSQAEGFISHLIHRHGRTIKTLWESYNQQRSEGRYLRVTEAQQALGYLMAFHPNNLQRNSRIFKRVADESPLFEKIAQLSSLHVLDLGCGGAAWSASFIDQVSVVGSPPQIHLDLIDRSKYFLLAAKEGLSSQWPSLKIKNLQADLRDAKAQGVIRKIHDECAREDRLLVIGLSYVWNEISSAKAKHHLLDLLQSVFRSTVPVIFSFAEPGREAEAREGMDFRQWLDHQGLYLLYPCPAAGDCPMLKTGQDWCYSEVPDHRLEEWSRISQSLMLQRKKLATASYLALNDAAMEKLSMVRKDPRQARIVGFPEVSGYRQTLICTEGRLKREKFFSPTVLRGELKR
jgi:SAM-dependent methyltransferase